ncbi:MAG: MATE family efflux transporter [Clostridia bacterium]
MNEKSMELNQITEGRLAPALIKFVIPLMLALLLQALYSAVDLIIVGQYGTPASVSAVAMGGQIMNTVTVIVCGITVGGTVLIGKLYGARNYERTAKAIGNITLISIVMAVVLTAIVVGASRPLASVMNVPAEAFEQCVTYTIVCGSGIVFIVGYNLLSSIFRGLGNSKLPFIFIAIACVINIILDLVFVGALKMDSLGAAIATIIAQGVSVILSLIFIKKKGFNFALNKSHFKFDKSTAFQLLKIGTPIALNDGLTSISFVVISAFINVLGLVASASVGIAERTFLFLIIVPMSFMTAISTFVAQNMGAGNEKRVMQSFKIGLSISILFGVIIFLFTYFGGGIIAKLFTKDALAIASTAEYMKGCSFEYLSTSIGYCLMGYFNGRGKTIFVMAQGIVVAFGVRIPLSYAFTTMENWTMYQIGTAVPISTIVSLVCCIAIFVWIQYSIKYSRNLGSKLLKLPYAR